MRLGIPTDLWCRGIVLLSRLNYLTDKNRIDILTKNIPESAKNFAINIPKDRINEIIIRTNIQYKTKIDENEIVRRNELQIPALISSCRYAKYNNNSRDFTLTLFADGHGDKICLENALEITNNISMIDGLISLGDCVPNVVELGRSYSEYWKDIVNTSNKPCYFVMGNHEKGTYPQILGNPTDEQLYNEFIKIMIDKGWLKMGEYIENKCYYHHDFIDSKIRLIVLDEYEIPFIIDDSIWKPIPYDQSLSNYVIGNSYSSGEKVNVPNYLSNSFEAKQNVTCDVYYGKNVPCYKYIRGLNYISETQMNWLLDTLYNTPADYSVIIACHNPFSNNATNLQNKKFSQKNGWINGQGRVSVIIEDYLPDIINAFINKLNYEATYTVNPIYQNINGYSVKKDFSSVKNGVKFHSLIGGHVHQDCVWKHDTYNIYQITPVCANTTYYAQSNNSDVRRRNSSIKNTIDVDALTIESFGNNRIGLVRFGNLFTENGDKRDFEIIKIGD